MKIKFTLIILVCSIISYAQVGIGTTTPYATLEIKASSVTAPNNNDGLLIPKIDEFSSTNPTANQDGMLVYITGDGSVSTGFYYWNNNSTSWLPLDSSIEKINDLLDGKSDNDGSDNYSSLFLGYQAGENDNATNNANVGVGYKAMFNNTSGNQNIAFGNGALYNNTSGYKVSAIGKRALYNNTTEYANVAKCKTK